MNNSHDYQKIYENNNCNKPHNKEEIEITPFERQAVDYFIDGHQINGDYNDFKNFSYNQLRTLLSLEQIDEFPCYFMHYYGGYNFEDYLKVGSTNIMQLFDFLKKKQLYPPNFSKNNPENSYKGACTSFSAITPKGHRLLGRNYDSDRGPALLLCTSPPCAYSSISMVDLSYLNYSRNIFPYTLWERRHFLSSPYFTFDGMNECGVAISVFKLSYSTPTKFPGKIALLVTSAMRLVLDYAKNVDEAIKLLKQFNISFVTDQAGNPIYVHLIISDSLGDSAIIEFLDGDIKIIRSNERWQVITNFILYGYKPGEELDGTGSDRYKLASEILRSKNGIVTTAEAMDILNRVKMPTAEGIISILQTNWSVFATGWSAVYDLDNGELNLVLGRKYDTVKKINLLDKFFSNK
ncbi:linear amide C-N hydrolase [Clostridium aestuarii]|uniref:Linear amide C-N hydrolase n=1 Tax=Clostridium aestuarii TaxID=338193 RepID=A0ABT4CVL7_9CLOT|nr:C45 family peptidase [Clostridium aestuarii]MCY6483030.1 linear amide C-N hydrolase [Clostridium aestuarii]